MKLQHLAVIFVIIIVPIALVLSTYTDGLIKVINNEAHYDTVLTNATYDAIRAYQMNTLHNSFASVNNSRERDINASVNSFFNSLSLGLDKSGYTKTELNEYIPSMLFTLYDGYYVYGPFKNVGSIGTVGTGNGLKRAQYSTTEDTKLEYGLMPYTYYSCEYQGTASDGSQFDIVINYSLDNYISISGTHGKDSDGNDRYITASGYYINSNKVQINESTRTATLTNKGDRDITITPETLGEYISFTDELKVKDIDGNRTRIVKQAVHETPVYYNYINYNEVKYYLMPQEEINSTDMATFNTSYDGIPIFVLDNDVRVFINNDMLKEIAKHTKFSGWDTNPENLYAPENFKDVNAFNYYKNAKEFSEKVHPYLKDINVRENTDGTYGDVKSVFFNNQYEVYPSDRNGENYNSAHVKVSYSELSKACPFDFTLDGNDPEEEVSIFNNHRIDVIVSSIESSLVNSIGNFNNYVSNTFSYAMPTLSESDWYKIANNLTTVSFMQGLPVGKYKFYSNYAVVTNKKNKEFIGRDAIYVQDTVEGLSQAEHEANYVAKSLPEYHSPSCEEYNRDKSGASTGVVGYRNIDYEEEPVLNTYPKLNDTKTQILDEDSDGKRDEITQSLNYYFQPGTGAYECIISRNQNRITTDDLIGQKSTKTVRRGDELTSTILPISETVQTAYISALAREKGASYKHHSGLNYHRYMNNGTELGENIDKTYNDIDKNFSDENNLNVPTVTDPDYNGEVVPITPSIPPHTYYFNGKVVSIKVGEEISSNALVDTDIPGMPTIKSINDMNIATNNIGGITGSSRVQGLRVGQTSVFLETSVNGTTYTARSTVIVTPADTPPPTELDNEEIKIYEVATTGERDITSKKVTMLTNERMNIHATKTDSRDVLTATSSDTNKIKIPQWNNSTDRGTIRANTKTLNPVTVIISGNMIVANTGAIASANFECDVVEQVIDIGNITISAGETYRLGADDGADIKIELVKDENLIYELYTIPGNDGVVTLDPNTGNLTGNKQGSAILVITGETSGATRQVIITVTDNRAIYYATLHSDGTLAFANTEAASKISGKMANKTYAVTLGTEQKFMTNANENNNVVEVRFVEPITVRGQKIEWFTNWPNLHKLVNEGNLKTDNITDMRKLFYKCTKLEGNLDLNSWNTGKVQYMERMFEDCESVNNIYLSNWNTENVRDMQYMFKGCKKLERITANATTSTWNVNNVTKMQYMFNSCLSLKTATLNNWDAGNVDTMEYMFSDCISLENINISTWNTLNLRDTRYMFSNCMALKTVIAMSSQGNFTTANVENMSYMFTDCQNVTTFTLNNWDTRKAEKMQSLFSGCSAIMSMDLSSWVTSARTLGDNKEKDQEMMFNNCTALRSLNLYEWILGQKVVSMFNNCTSLQTNTFNIARVKTNACTDMSNMFAACESLTSLNLVSSGEYWDVSNVTRMINMFRGCKKMRTINVANWDVRNTTTFINMFTACEALQGINLESWNNNWYKDGINLDSMFSYCKKLTNINLRGLVNTKVTTMANMFESCDSITNFSWNSWNWNVSKVTDMSSFLRGGEELRTVNLDLAQAGGEIIVTNLENFYTSCRKLTNVSMNNWKANNLTAVHVMFDDCKKLQTVEMNNWEVAQITTLGTMLSERDNLTTVSMNNWKAPKLSNINRVFYRTKSLTTVNMTNLESDNLTSVYGMFEGIYYTAPAVETVPQREQRESYTRDRLTTVDMSGWKCPNLQDMSRMFMECRALTTANLSNGNTSNVRYMNDMFNNCQRLRTANLSGDNTENVTNMRNMFLKCQDLRTVNLSALNTTNVSMYNLEGMFVGCRDAFTLIINSQENNTYGNYNRSKLRRAYDEDANSYGYYYTSSYRYKIFGHYTNRYYWNDKYYWEGTVNFVVY